jgi:Domain of unknown function (DUF4375)
MTKAKLHKSDIEKDPNLFWNAFIDVVGGDEAEPRSEIQQWAHYCFRYDGEVMNGGHFQFFENNGLVYAMLVLSSLEKLELSQSYKILASAFSKAQNKKWGEIDDVEEYVEMAAAEPFKAEDELYHDLNPDLLHRLQSYAAEHKDEFFEIVAP